MKPVEVTIDRGIAVPGSVGRPTKYPWREMSVGDSFFVAARDHAERRRLAKTLQASGTAYCRRNQLAVRCITRVRDGGVRVWLVAKLARATDTA